MFVSMVPEKFEWRKEVKLGHWKQIYYYFPLSVYKHAQNPSGQGRQTSLSDSFRFCMRRRYCLILLYRRGHFFKMTIFSLPLFQWSLFTIYSWRSQYSAEISRETFRWWKPARHPTELECFSQRKKKSANAYVLAYAPERASWTAHKQLPFRNNKSPCQRSRDRGAEN